MFRGLKINYLPIQWFLNHFSILLSVSLHLVYIPSHICQKDLLSTFLRYHFFVSLFNSKIINKIRTWRSSKIAGLCTTNNQSPNHFPNQCTNHFLNQSPNHFLTHFSNHSPNQSLNYFPNQSLNHSWTNLQTFLKTSLQTISWTNPLTISQTIPQTISQTNPWTISQATPWSNGNFYVRIWLVRSLSPHSKF